MKVRKRKTAVSKHFLWNIILVQLPSITQIQSPTLIAVGAGAHRQILIDPSNAGYNVAHGRAFVNEQGELLVDYTPINSVYIKCPRCQQVNAKRFLRNF